MKPIKGACLLLCLVFATGVVHAQGVGASGDITGTVTDPSGAGIPKATILVVETDKGIQHTAETDTSGEYRLAGLAPATYDVTVKISGFQTAVQKGVILTVGATVVVDFHVKITSASELVEVNAESPVVETQRGGQANTVTQQYIEDLPIGRRDYLTFTLLMPGVSDSTRMASDTDFRVKQTPQSGLSFYGSNGRGNTVTVDGGEANDDSGGVRLTLSQEAVQEFQINRSNYSAELGGASGAAVNIVTKSGTNETHGTLYGFFRNDAMDARNPFSFSQALQPGSVFNPAVPDSQGQPVKDTLSRQQFGGTVGFPIHKDKTFLFVAFEGLRQGAQNAVPLLTSTNIFRPDDGIRSLNNQVAIINALSNAPGNPAVPCINNPNGTITTLPAAVCAGLLRSALTIAPTTGLSLGAAARNAFLNSQFEANGGLFNYNTREYFASGHFDHHFNEANQLSVNYRFGHDREENPDVQSLTGFSRGSSIHNYDHTLQAAWFHRFSPRTQNEARVQWNYNGFDVIPNEPGEVGLDIPGFANLGTNIFLPSLTIARRYELADNFTMVRGHHTMKFGGYFLYRGNHTESHTFFPGRFVFGSLPGFLLSGCLANPNGPVTNNPQTTGCALPGTLNSAIINSLQSVSLGAPQFYQQGFDNPVYNYPRPFGAGFWQDSWNIWPNFTLNYGLRYEIDAQYGPLSTDKNNFAPRVSFAWDPFKNHKTVIRGGYGIFYSQVYGQIADVAQTLGVLDPNGRPVTNLATCSASPNACSRQIAQIFVPLQGIPGLSSAAIFQTLFAQGKVSCTTPAGGAAACITPADLTQFGIAVTHTGSIPPLTVLFSGQPDYRNPYSQQAELGIEREIAKGLSVSASYIYVHTIGLPVAIDINLLPAPFVPAGPAGIPIRQWSTSAGSPCAGAAVFTCFVNPSLLQNNQYSSAGAALYHGGILEIKKRFSDHFTLLGSYTFSKAIDEVTDFNSDFGPMDQTNLAGERGLSTFDQRHKFVIAAVLESPWKNRILAGFQVAPIVRYNSEHPFNLLAGTNVNNDRHSTNDRPPGAGRNTGIGPDYVTFDMRLSRAFKLTEKANVQLMAEGFNIFNRTNFASVNNVVGVIAPPFRLSGTEAASPSQPL
ncbi:MAG TPA: TonB-dependent receptor, partial [Candidatus Polarisedimenticolia bacterium]|nr:TonB-dependent receptor [Candidatus Polarisedimenticolia bacterium]